MTPRQATWVIAVLVVVLTTATLFVTGWTSLWALGFTTATSVVVATVLIRAVLRPTTRERRDN
jgi:predicted Abi (CAAX) family protease